MNVQIAAIEPGVNGVRSLRALLKNARRRFGLIAIDAREEMTPGRFTYTELRRASGKSEATATRRHNE
jgi:hypothetical protein